MPHWRHFTALHMGGVLSTGTIGSICREIYPRGYGRCNVAAHGPAGAPDRPGGHPGPVRASPDRPGVTPRR
ncbi:hypothetical protein [Ornithinimicrobium kibberense]|uniref:hypothetical protein n=1 Tax=Ornithinimicrobium kibberense TaxID=282060 RepID=UPI0036152734